MRHALVLLFSIIILSACASTSTPTAPAPLPTAPTSAPASSIEFHRSGGFAGFNDVLLIDAKGHVTIERRNGKSEFDLTPEQWAQLQNAFRDAGFASIPENSMSKPLAPDEMSYSLTFQDHTVKTSDTALPEKLRPLITQLTQLLSK
jgi:hypothetical protein